MLVDGDHSLFASARSALSAVSLCVATAYRATR